MAGVCQRLDGVPLAIEPAAARLRALSPEELQARLDDRFRLLTGGSRPALPRQQTLRSTIDWSYDLLSEPERALLRRLSVFAGGWTLEAAEAVCGVGRDGVVERWSTGGADRSGPSLAARCAATRSGTSLLQSADVLDLLTNLVDISLVIYEQPLEGEGRYRLLETVRQYARDRLLESGEGAAARRKHRDFYVELAKRDQAEHLGYAPPESSQLQPRSTIASPRRTRPSTRTAQ